MKITSYISLPRFIYTLEKQKSATPPLLMKGGRRTLDLKNMPNNNNHAALASATIKDTHNFTDGRIKNKHTL